MYYQDLREYIGELRAAGLLIDVERPVDKNRELQPLVRVQFQSLPEPQRKAFLFHDVRDPNGRGFEMPVLIGHTASSRQIYALGLRCKTDEINERWREAIARPIPPVMVERGPVHEIVLSGDALATSGGLGRLPVPIATPGFDNACYTSASHWTSKDPETGIRNVGNYRGMLKSRDRLGCFVAVPIQGMYQHWLKARRLGRPHLEAAIAIGTTPNLTYAATTRLPADVDEYAVAGALSGRPFELVKAVTADLEVPAHAEIVIEGTIPTDALEPEGPFGEFTGYMARRIPNLFLNVRCITMRRNAIYAAIVSQFPPSESSKLRQIGVENVLHHRLVHEYQLPEVVDVGLDEFSGSVWLCAIKVRPTSPERADVIRDVVRKFGERWPGKLYVLVDEDVDVRSLPSLMWAITGRMQPHRDMTVFPIHTPIRIDQSLMPPEAAEAARQQGVSGAKSGEASAMLIDARRRWAYPPLSLPAEPYMRRARELWAELGLPPIAQIEGPSHGVSLGYWSNQEEEEAAIAVEDAWAAGRHAEQERIPLPPVQVTAATDPRR